MPYLLLYETYAWFNLHPSRSIFAAVPNIVVRFQIQSSHLCYRIPKWEFKAADVTVLDDVDLDVTASKPISGDDVPPQF